MNELQGQNDTINDDNTTEEELHALVNEILEIESIALKKTKSTELNILDKLKRLIISKVEK